MWLLKKAAGFPNAESFAPGSMPEGEVGQPGASLAAHPQEEMGALFHLDNGI